MATYTLSKQQGQRPLAGARHPMGSLAPWWARLAYPLAGSGQRPFQTYSHWGFVQIPNSLLDFVFPTNFY